MDKTCSKSPGASWSIMNFWHSGHQIRNAQGTIAVAGGKENAPFPLTTTKVRALAVTSQTNKSNPATRHSKDLTPFKQAICNPAMERRGLGLSRGSQGGGCRSVPHRDIALGITKPPPRATSPSTNNTTTTLTTSPPLPSPNQPLTTTSDPAIPRFPSIEVAQRPERPT